jgi:hypothetical protein
MSDRWKLQIMNLEGEEAVLKAEPIPTVMTDFVAEAVKELTRRCAIAEEQMIFGSSPTETLIRIRDFCDAEIKSRSQTEREE